MFDITSKMLPNDAKNPCSLVITMTAVPVLKLFRFTLTLWLSSVDLHYMCISFPEIVSCLQRLTVVTHQSHWKRITSLDYSWSQPTNNIGWSKCSLLVDCCRNLGYWWTCLTNSFHTCFVTSVNLCCHWYFQEKFRFCYKRL